jgi:hypothetical protein
MYIICITISQREQHAMVLSKDNAITVWMAGCILKVAVKDARSTALEQASRRTR